MTTEATRAYQREWRQRNRERVAEYRRRYAAEHVEERAEYRRAYYIARRPEALERQREYHRTHARAKEDPEKHARHIAADRHKHPDHYKARLALAYAVRSGRLVRGPCAVCGTTPTQGHHHEGYAPDKHLVVTWLCKVHHGEAHRLVLA